MTKKHMEFVAALILASRDGVSAENLAIMAAATFIEENPRFDPKRFFKACGVGGADKMTS